MVTWLHGYKGYIYLKSLKDRRSHVVTTCQFGLQSGYRINNSLARTW
jgi:hypothetical protein